MLSMNEMSTSRKTHEDSVITEKIKKNHITQGSQGQNDKINQLLESKASESRSTSSYTVRPTTSLELEQR